MSIGTWWFRGPSGGSGGRAKLGWGVSSELEMAVMKALVWFWLIDETVSANLIYQSGHEIGSTIPSVEAMTKIMTMVMAWL